MSYQIVYGQTERKHQPKSRRWTYALVFSMLLGALFGLRFFGIREASWECLLPGDCHVTASALDAMLRHIQSGEGLLDAIDVFCSTVVESAQLG